MSIETKTYDISEIEEIITNENKQDNHKEKIGGTCKTQTSWQCFILTEADLVRYLCCLSLSYD